MVFAYQLFLIVTFILFVKFLPVFTDISLSERVFINSMFLIILLMVAH